MTDSNVFQLNTPATNPLNEVLKQCAKELLAKAIEVKVAELLMQYSELKVDGKQAVVGNDHLPERGVRTWARCRSRYQR